jgi:hypothetical protein
MLGSFTPALFLLFLQEIISDQLSLPRRNPQLPTAPPTK